MDNTHIGETEGGLDLIWGAAAIGRAIARNERQTFFLLETGKIPAKKVGGRYCADRGELRAFFTRPRSES
jgi:hypothetical protein